MSSVAKEIPETLLANFHSAHWIWTPEDDVDNPPLGSRAFRNTYTTPAGKNATSALILITVDDKYSLFVNGQRVGTSPYGTTWMSAQIFNVAPLDPQSNLFALNGTNIFNPFTGAMFGPAGVLCAIQITFSDRTTTTFSSDRTWKSFKTVSAGFESLSTDDSTWGKSIPVAHYGSGIWGENVSLPVFVPSQTIISLPDFTVSTAGSQTTTSSAPFSTSRSTIFPLPNSTASTTVSGTTTASVPRSTTAAPATPAPSNSKANVSTVVGGVVGGLTSLILTVVLIIFLKRQKMMRGYDGKVNGTRSAGDRQVITPFPLTPRVPIWAGKGAGYWVIDS